MTSCRRWLLCALILVMLCVFIGSIRHSGYAENGLAGNVPAPADDLPKTAINPQDGAEMILIPAGEFLMGSADTDQTGSSDERPQHAVSLDAYYIYKTDVTVAQYRKFCEATGRPMPKPPTFGWGDDYPMIGVNWDDANAYAQWAGAALPTEAQWEKAARGTDGRQYPWGNEWDPVKCRWAKSDEKPHPVPVGGVSTDISPYGVLDMAGNIEQWCADWYGKDYYQQAPAQNPTGPEDGTARVLRGGCWMDSNPLVFRAATRKKASPTLRSGRVSFRCAMLPAQLATPEEAEPADDMARVQITTDPAGATIFLNRTRVGKPSNCTIKTDLGEAATRTVQLTFTLDGYEDEVRSVTLERGKTIMLAVTLRTKAAPAAPPAVVTPPIKPDLPAEDSSAPVNLSAEKINARLAEVKDHLFFLTAPEYFSTTQVMVEFDGFLVPNGQYAKTHYTWSKLVSTDGANILRKATAKELENDSIPLDQILYYTTDKVRPDYAVGSVQLQIPSQFARVVFDANGVNVARRDGPLNITLLACTDSTCSMKMQGKLTYDDLIVILRDAAGRPLTIRGTELVAIDDEMLGINETVSGKIAKVEIYTPVAYVTNTLGIQAFAPPETDGATTINPRTSRYIRINHAVKGVELDQEQLKAQVSVSAQRRTTSEWNCPIVLVQLPYVLNSAYAQISYGKPELTDKNGDIVTYDPEESGFDPETFTSAMQFTNAKGPFAFATGKVHLLYPARLNTITLTPAQPENGGMKAKFDGCKVRVYAKDSPEGYDLPEDLSNIRAYDAGGRQLARLDYSNDGGTIYWGNPAEVRVITVDKWLDIDLPYHLPPAADLTDE